MLPKLSRFSRKLCKFVYINVIVKLIVSAHLSGRRHRKAVASARARARRKQFQEETKSNDASTEEPQDKQTQQR